MPYRQTSLFEATSPLAVRTRGGASVRGAASAAGSRRSSTRGGLRATAAADSVAAGRAAEAEEASDDGAAAPDDDGVQADDEDEDEDEDEVVVPDRRAALTPKSTARSSKTGAGASTVTPKRTPTAAAAAARPSGRGRGGAGGRGRGAGQGQLWFSHVESECSACLSSRHVNDLSPAELSANASRKCFKAQTACPHARHNRCISTRLTILHPPSTIILLPKLSISLLRCFSSRHHTSRHTIPPIPHSHTPLYSLISLRVFHT